MSDAEKEVEIAKDYLWSIPYSEWDALPSQTKVRLQKNADSGYEVISDNKVRRNRNQTTD